MRVYARVCPWPTQTDPSYRPSLVTPSPNGGAAVPPFAGSDLVLSPSQWSSHVVGEPPPPLSRPEPSQSFPRDTQHFGLTYASGQAELSRCPLGAPAVHPGELRFPGAWSVRVRCTPGKLSPWMDLDSRDPVLRKDSEQTLKQELSWASHLSLQVALYPTAQP